MVRDQLSGLGLFLWYLYRPRLRRRRVFVGAVSLVLCLSVTAQQTQAIPILMTTTLPKMPHVGPTFGQLFGAYARMALRAIGGLLPTSGGSAPSPAAPTGMPNPWQAADPAGPYSLVNLSNGTLFTRLRIVSWDGIDFSLYHSAGNPATTIGGNWSHSFSDRLHVSGSSAAYYTADGREIDFTISDNQAENTIYRLKLSYNSSTSEWTITRADQTKLVFASGKLQRVVDASGTETTMHYTNGLLDTITDAASRVLSLSYTSGRLTGISAPPLSEWNATTEEFDDVDRNWALAYDPVRHVLTQVTNARGHQNAFTYTSLIFLATVTDYENKTWNYYYTNDRCTKCKHPAVSDYVVGGSPIRYERNYTYTASSGHVTKTVVTDERGEDWEYNFESGGRLTSTKDPLNRTTATFEWNGDNRPCSITNVLGGETTLTYDSAGNPETVTTPRGTTTMDFDTLNNLVSITDALSHTTTYAYSDTANPTRVTQINGPGQADIANFAWGTGTGTGGNGTPPGQVQSMGDSNGVQQSTIYDVFWNAVQTSSGWFQSGGGPSNSAGDAYLVNNPTGEAQSPGHALASDADKACGCNESYDAEGNTTKFTCQCTEDCTGRHDPPGEEPGGDDDPPEAGPCSAPDEFTYDGNNRLTFAPDSPGGTPCDGLGHHFEYDARGRQKLYKADAPDGAGQRYSQIERFWSDSTGRSSTRQTVELYGGGTDTHIFEHEYKTDTAGRLSEVWRKRNDGDLVKVLSYEYQDGQTSWNIRETRQNNVGYTDYYLDTDGAIREIAHYSGSGTPQLAASYTYTRDDLGRITHVDESRWDPVTEGYLTADTDYAYGSGTLDEDDLDEDSTAEVEADKLHYSWLASLGGGKALESGDPNRLVKERRYSSSAAMGPYKKEYWYDPGGNRLAMRESTPASSEANDSPTKITRYNYWFMPKTDFSGGDDRPFMPLVNEPFEDAYEWSGGPSMTTSAGLDYEGVGQNKLVSKEVFDLNDENLATATRYEYKAAIAEEGLADPYNWNFLAVSAKVTQAAEHVQGGWNATNDSSMGFQYDKDMQMISAGSEAYKYDIFGRRWTRNTGQRGWFVAYDGQQVAAEYEFRTLFSTYTMGALGPAIRTDCKENFDDDDDQDAWYLWDASGGAVGMMVYDETSESYPAAFQVHDAFGNLISEHSGAAAAGASYAWRGQEGSESDLGFAENELGTRLVYMQARYYDPEIGRFLRADDLPMASTTSQGLNRYLYCANDPVNQSDPSGLLIGEAVAFAAGAYAGFLWGEMDALFGMDPTTIGKLAGGIIGGLAKLAKLYELTKCLLLLDIGDLIAAMLADDMASWMVKKILSVSTLPVAAAGLNLVMAAELGWVFGWALGYAAFASAERTEDRREVALARSSRHDIVRSRKLRWRCCARKV